MRLIQQASEVANHFPVFNAVQEIKKHCRTLYIYKHWHHGHIFEDFLVSHGLCQCRSQQLFYFSRTGHCFVLWGTAQKKNMAPWVMFPESYLPCHLPKLRKWLLAAQVTCAINLQKSDLVNFWIPCGSVIRKAWAGTTSILGIHERNWHGLDTWCFQLTFSRLFQDLGLWCVWRSGNHTIACTCCKWTPLTQQSSLTPQYEGWTCTLRSTRYPKRNALK